MLVLDRDRIVGLCREFDVRRLLIFGSALTEQFDSERSDVDFLVEFADDAGGGLELYFGFKDAIENLLGRPVDLVSPEALENPYFAASVTATAEEIYAA